MALELIDKSCLSEVRFETPTTKDTKTSGTTSSLRRERKILPRASINSEKKFKRLGKLSWKTELEILPKVIPRSIPRRIFAVKDI